MNIVFWISVGVVSLVGLYYLFTWIKTSGDSGNGDDDNGDIPEPEPTKKVEKKIQITEIKKKRGKPFFLSSLSIFEGLWTDRITVAGWKYLLDNFVEYVVGNWTRSFLMPAAPWAYKYLNWLIPPFIKKNGLYQLPKPWEAEAKIGEYLNPDFVAHLVWVIRKKTEREAGEMLSLWDNCGFHTVTAAWNHNFLNPINNNIGEYLSEDPHGYYRYADENSPGDKLKNTGKIVEAVTRYLLRVIYDALSEEQRKFVAFEAVNEGFADEGFHSRMSTIIDEIWGAECPRSRRFTSADSAWTKGIKKQFTPIVHRIGTIELYNLKVPTFSCGISTDGFKVGGQYSPAPVDYATMRAILERAYNSNKVLLETLNGHRQNHIRLPGAPQNTTENKAYYDFSAMRWDDMKRVADKLIELVYG